ncbi:trans-sialidase, putative [Trypanosoma cruzi marinkellei]|uniref:Trans-sialidase, putative n=1 Tax=Trypanosoma cruzi marinkellei TaxID=85056 RepID=K2N087_TRYCR|nr:trans-sialidase, putative [Trypanosoma cruzi marinkellei]
MHSRVAAVKAPRTHNRRCVTGSSGRRREGGESERQRPNMSRRVFASVVLFIVVVMMCCGTGGAANGKGQQSLDVQLPQEVDIFVPGTTLVEPKNGSGKSDTRGSFSAPSLVRAGGVMVAFAEGHTEYKGSHYRLSVLPSGIVAGYINAAETWPLIAAEKNKDKWRVRTLFSTVNEEDLFGVARNPTAIAKDNKVLLLVGSYNIRYDTTESIWRVDGWNVQLVEGVATQATDGVQSALINWGKPRSLLQQIPQRIQSNLSDFGGGGGSGIVMENGTLVFPLTATKKDFRPFSMITYSTDNGNTWVFPEGVFADCFNPRITEWEKGQIFMIVQCNYSRKVFESRDMGKKWTKAIGALSGVWANSQLGVFGEDNSLVGALITATIEGVKVMLYTRKRSFSGDKNENVFYLWVTDNNRTLYVGPVAMDNNLTLSQALLYSDGALYLLKESGNSESKTISLVPLTEELQMINYFLKNWAQLDASFSESSIPTAGLVGFLSNATSDDNTWIDEYRCLNATVKNATKVENGFKFTGPGSWAAWPVNSREDNTDYGFVNYDFTLVATVVIHWVPNVSTSLLGASLGEDSGNKIIGLSYNPDSKWETVFDGTKKAHKNTWEPGKEYQLALTLQDGKKGSVYVDGVLVGSSDKIPTLEVRGREISNLYIGGDEGGTNSSVTVTNVFLYNRPLSAGELKMVHEGEDKKGKGDGSMRGGVSQLLPMLLGLWGIVTLY